MQCYRFVEKIHVGFQLRSELTTTVERWAKFRWKWVPDDWRRDGKTELSVEECDFV